MPTLQDEAFLSGPVKHAAINISSSGDNTVITAVPGKRIKVQSIFFNAASAVAATVKSGASTALTGPLNTSNLLSIGISGTPEGLFKTAIGEALVINLSSAVSVAGFLTYREVD